jgi:hypothetical protein
MMGDDFSALLGAEFTDGFGQIDSEQATTTIVSDLPVATKAGQRIISNSSYTYWDGNVDSHNWGSHGWSGRNRGDAYDKSRYLESGPRVIWNHFGNMAIRASHYVSEYDDQGNFLGFVPMNTRTAVPQAVYAGQMIATVVQYFWHKNPYSGAGTHPWKYYKNKALPAKALWFSDKQVAEDGKTPLPNYYPAYHVADDISIPANGIPTDVKIGKWVDVPGPFNNRIGRNERSLTRYIDARGPLGGTKKGADKFEYAFTPQWISPSSGGNLQSLSPSNSTNDVGKAVWVYRFPKQLDDNSDATQIDYWKNLHGADYSMSNTNKAYGFPKYTDKNKKWSLRKGVETKECYSVLGRMEDDDYNPISPSKDNSLDAGNKIVAELNDDIYMTRKEIPVIPMMDSFFEQPPGWMGGIESDSTLQLHFDTTDTGAQLGFRITDPERYAYLSNPSVNHAFFPQKNFSNIGDQFLVIGQALIPYDENSVDSKLNTFQSSERMMLATGSEVTTSVIYEGMKAGFRSVEEDPSRRGVTNLGERNWDYMVPKVVVTTRDLEAGRRPLGYEALEDFMQKYAGTELSDSWIASLPLTNPATGTQSSTNPGYYTISLGGSYLDFPYSIALFEIYQGYRGPILELDEEGNPLNTKDGHIFAAAETPEGRASDAKFYYFTQTGKWVKQSAYFHKFISESTGNLEDDITTPGFTDPAEDVTVSWLEEDAQRSAWLSKYKNEFFVIPGSMSQYFIPGSDRVTGQQIYDAWVSSGAAFELPLFNPSANFAGIGNLPFKKTFGVVVEDVTEKWGEIGSNRARYTGDMNMQAVQRGADVGAEQLGYVAMTATHDDLGGPLDFITDPVQGKVDAVEKKVDSAIDTAKNAVEGGAGIAVGLPLGLLTGAGLGAIFIAALAAPAAIEKVRETVGDAKQIERKEQRRLPAPE